MERALGNLHGNDRSTCENERADRPKEGPLSTALFNEGWNRRDVLNAGNLRWLLEQGYPGRKLILWAHSSLHECPPPLA